MRSAVRATSKKIPHIWVKSIDGRLILIKDINNVQFDKRSLYEVEIEAEKRFDIDTTPRPGTVAILGFPAKELLASPALVHLAATFIHLSGIRSTAFVCKF